VTYVRTVKTASGATAVQIVHSNRRGSREIEHIGSAHSPAEVEVLRAAARQRLHAHRDAFDFGDGRPEGQALPITSTQSKHLWDALGWAYERLGLDVATDGDEVFVSWCWPGWLSRPASSTRSGCWPSSGSARRGIARSSAGSRSMRPTRGAKRWLRHARRMSVLVRQHCSCMT
jgi:hypothetical protein